MTGVTPNGEPIEGEYEYTDEFPFADGFDENVEFFTMTYEAPRPVAHNRAFEAIAPLLWLRAGSQGRRIEKAWHDFDVADTYAVLFDLDASQDFLTAVVKGRISAHLRSSSPMTTGGSRWCAASCQHGWKPCACTSRT